MNPSPNPPSSATPATADSWRTGRRLLLIAASVATLIGVFYTVENWRGRRAWEQSRHGLEAKGEVLDWAAYIPAPVPEDQNFYKAPHMQEWFVKGPLASLPTQLTNPPRPFVLAPRKDAGLVLAEVKVVAPNTPLDTRADAVLQLKDPSAPEQAAKLLQQTLGPCAIGTRMNVLVAHPLDQIQPLHLVLEADTAPTLKDLAALFPHNPVTNLALAYSTVSYVEVTSPASNSFRVALKAPVYSAADYLAWTEPLTPDFDLVRQALQRPYARIDCDYQQPFGIAIPNFVTLRSAAQILSERAQADLLLGQPEAAWHNLSLVHDLCQILLVKPSGKPLTLVGAMINVAVLGLETSIIEDGLRLHAWRDPQLLALQQQLQTTDLLAPVVEAFKEERAATCRTLETMPRGELARMLGSSGIAPRLVLTLLPQGWFYQNMVLGTKLEQGWIGSIDLTNRLVLARQVSDTVSQASHTLSRRSPYNFLVAIAVPNFARAVQTAARNQTLIDQAQVACVLERYRLSQGQYPETLQAVLPQYIGSLPHDLIGGQPLKYRRTDTGGYLLYSIGWNEKDDGGIPGSSREDGDWVWAVH